MLYVFSSDLCTDSAILPINTELLTIIDQVNLARPSDDEIMNAKCKTKSSDSIDVMEKFINNSSGAKKSETINEVSFNDESVNALKAFSELTTNKDLFTNNVKKDLQSPIQSKYSINPECQKVLCAVKKIWGNELGTKLLYMKMKYGLNGSEIAYSDEDMNVERLKMDEIDDMLMTIGDLPKEYQSIFKNQSMIHVVLKDDIPTNIANASIMLFDRWVGLSRPQRQYALFHEFSHNVSSQQKEICSSEQWHKLSGWKTINDGQKWEFDLTKACFATNYAKKNPSEDFAEAMTMYRYAPEKLKLRCPKKYQFLKSKIFNKREFLDGKCEN